MPLPNRNVIKTFEKNTRGTDYVVGDLHGGFGTLKRALEAIRFNPQTDRLFSVGDLVDRGPYSHLVYHWIKQPWFHSVMGNHEVKVLQYLQEKGIAEQSKEYMIELYSLGEYKRKQIETWLKYVDPKEDIVNIFYEFNNLPIAMEVPTNNGLVGVLHADILHSCWHLFKTDLIQDNYQGPTSVRALRETNRYKVGIEIPVAGVTAIFVGHKSVPKVEVLGNVCYIDTGCGYDNALTIVSLDTFKEFTVSVESSDRRCDAYPPEN